MEFWELHGHSRYSANDALPSPEARVARAVELGYPALGLTDHATIAGAVQHYLACKRANIKPLIGVEAYVAVDRRAHKRPRTMHMLFVAVNLDGYRNLCTLTSRSYAQFSHTPVLDLFDLAEMHEKGELEGIIATTGCWFGLLPKLMREGFMVPILNVLRALSSWFPGRLFVEVQNHQITTHQVNESDHNWLLFTLADVLGLPVVLGQDSHYLRPEDQPLHNSFKELLSWSSSSDDWGGAGWPGDGYHMVDTEWMADHHPEIIFEAGMAGLRQIYEMTDLHIPELDTYNFVVPDITISGDPARELTERCESELKLKHLTKAFPASRYKDYKERLATELAVINGADFGGYLLLVAAVCEFMACEQIRYRTRGSATGSLVCWLLGITGYDPIRTGLSFGRFLSSDRTKPPDVDLDVEHERRGLVLDWLEQRFSTVHIGTANQYGVNESDSEDPTGSMRGLWRSQMLRRGLDKETKPPAQIIKAMHDIVHYNGTQPDGTAVDSPLKSIGQHAAGILIAPDDATLALVPTQYISTSKVTITAYDMDDIEKLGLVKLDVLGLRELTALMEMESITGINAMEVPLTDAKTYRMISSGKTVGLFQLEGWAATKGVRAMRPRRITDIVAAMALFRPATISSGAMESYLNRRIGQEEIPERHPLLTKHTADTYGVLIYQEQAINILTELGLSPEEVETARKAIKASNANVGGAAKKLAGLKEHIFSLATDLGFNRADLAFLSNTLDAYAGYSFNKAHATAYGVLAYQTAYFRAHHPVAFWTGTLKAYADAPKKKNEAVKPEIKYLNEARLDGVIVRGPHVNRSEISYSSDGRQIFQGLISIDKVGATSARHLYELGPFRSLDDLARKVTPKIVTGANDLGKGHSPASCPGVVRHLWDAGALEGLEREA